MERGPVGPLIGRDEQLNHLRVLRRDLRSGGIGHVLITGDAGSGKSHFLRTCADRAGRDGWEVLYGQCTEETASDPYGPFLSMLGLCFDKAGRLINDHSVYSIVDQISLDDVFDAIQDIPGMSVVAFGIKVGMSIFESRRGSQQQDLLNLNFEFLLQVLQQIGSKRKRPIFVALDDLHLASSTTYALLEYILTRIQDTRLFVAATWRALSPEEGLQDIRDASLYLAQADRALHLPPLSNRQIRQLLARLAPDPPQEALADMLVQLCQGMPGTLSEGLRLIELEGEGVSQAGAIDRQSSLVQTLIARQMAQLTPQERSLLECAALFGPRVPLDVIAAPPLCSYLGIGERPLLVMIADLADAGALLAWDGGDRVRFTSRFVHHFLRHRPAPAVRRRDHLRLAEGWQAVEDEPDPARLARHYLAGQRPEQALTLALHSANQLLRSAAYPEAVESYRTALEAWAQTPDREDRQDTRYEILSAMSLAAEQAGDWDEAVDRLQEARQIGAEDTARQAEIHASLGWICHHRGEVQAALEHLAHSKELYAALDDVQGCAQIDYYLGVVYSQQKEWQRAVECFERFLAAAERAGFAQGRASAYTEMGNLYRLQRQWSQAESFLQQGIELAEAEGDFVVLAQAYNYLGSCYALQGKPESVEMLHRALDIVSARTKQPAQEARIQNTLGETLVRLSRWQEAEEAFRASAAIKERLNDRPGLAMTYGGLGRLYLRQWRFEQAVEYLQKDIDLLADEFEANVAWIQQWTNWIGEARRLQGTLEEAARHLRHALAMAERIADPDVRRQSIGFSRMLLARLALDRDEWDAAQRECEAALQILSGTWAEGEVQRTAARLWRIQGDLERARDHVRRALAAAERGEEIDRALVYLEQAELYQALGNASGVRERVADIVRIAQRLENDKLERRARQLLTAM